MRKLKGTTSLFTHATTYLLYKLVSQAPDEFFWWKRKTPQNIRRGGEFSQCLARMKKGESQGSEQEGKVKASLQNIIMKPLGA